jgi:hypothetical protein
MVVELLASLFASATCCGHASSCVLLCRRGWVVMRLDLHRGGVGGIVAITPIAIEVWTSLWWNDRGHVGSERGSHAPIHCAWSCSSDRWEWVLR